MINVKLGWTLVPMVVAGIVAIAVIKLYRARVANMPGPVIVMFADVGDPPVHVPSGISGSFEGVYAGDGAKDANTGGACLVFQEGEDPPHCDSDAECSDGGVGYCIAKDANIRGCWFQPNPDTDYCKRGLPLPGGTYSLGPGKPFPPGTHSPIHWRVLTCQNLTPMGCKKDGGIQGVDKRYRYGLVTPVGHTD